MDDLSALKEHLDEQATPNFAGLFVARLEQTESDNETLALLESFWEVLDGEGGADRSMREFRMTSTLKEAGLQLVPAISPILSRRPAVRYAAEKLLLEGVGRYSSAREVILAVGERIENLVDEADAWEEDEANIDGSSEEDSDEEEEGEDEEHHHHDDLTNRPPLILPPVAHELPILIELLTVCLSRLSSKKSLPTFINLSTLLPPIFECVPRHTPTARHVMDRVGKLVIAAKKWSVGTTDWSAKGEQKSILLGILASAFDQLYPALDIQSAELIFTKENPRTREPGFGQGGWQAGTDLILETALELVPLAPTDTPSVSLLLPLLSSSSPDVAKFALLLLSHYLSQLSDPSTFFSSLPPPLTRSPSAWLETTLHNNLLASSGAGGVAWVLACLEEIKSAAPSSFQAAVPVKSTVASLFQLYLSPLAAHPSARYRQLLFSLTSSLLAAPFSTQSEAIDLVLPLLASEPSAVTNPLLRTVALHFLRSVLYRAPPRSFAWLAGPDGKLEAISEAVFRLPLGEAAPASSVEQQRDMFVWDETHDADGELWIRGPGPVFVVSALGIYQNLLLVDTKNDSGIRSPKHLESTQNRWLTPLRRRLNARKAQESNQGQEKVDNDEDEEEAESQGAFLTVEFALERVEAQLQNEGSV